VEKLPLSLQNLQFSPILHQLSDALLISNLAGECLWFNTAFETLLGYNGKAGFTLAQWATQLHLYELAGSAADANLITTASAKPCVITQERLGQLSGSYLPRIPLDPLILQHQRDDLPPETLLIETFPLYDHQHTLNAQLSLFKTINPAQAHLLCKPILQTKDEVTGIGNRVYFTQSLERALKEAARNHTILAVFILDLDRFKLVNNSLGHLAGDQALQLLTSRLLSYLPQHWALARLGGDEFAIVMHTSDETLPLYDMKLHNRLHPQVQQWAERILEIVSQPFKLGDQEIFITTSIGISLFPQHGHDCHSLMKHSEIALYRAKEMGGFTYQCYQAHSHQDNIDRLNLTSDLHHALARNEFEVFYQPQINLQNDQVIGYEALLRWQHPTAGRQSPITFIPILEETGLIDGVGIWLIESACGLLSNLKARLRRPLKMAVNLSARQFNDPKLSEKILRILQQKNIAAHELELEITESVLMSRHQDTLSTLQALTLAGVRLSIDDFGTGYSSLAYLKRFPIDTLKINKSFIADIERDADDAAIVKAIIAMAKSLNITVVAEGVENAAQMRFLVQEKCDIMQGFWISRPIDEANIIDWSQAHQAGFQAAELAAID
jgi:diguanylate cyclase (GGDEF)-like protein